MIYRVGNRPPGLRCVVMHKPRTALFRKLIVPAFPIMVGNLLQTLYNLVDAFFLGKLGKVAVSAPSMSFSIIFFLVVFAFGFSPASTTPISQAKGRRRPEKIDFYLGQTATIGFAVVYRGASMDRLDPNVQ